LELVLHEKNEEMNLPSREETRSNERYIKPAVNIIETEGLILTADIPCASRDTLDINVEKGILTISAPVARNAHGNAGYKEFELASYYRQFPYRKFSIMKKPLPI
jgi:HSP20 family protein